MSKFIENLENISDENLSERIGDLPNFEKASKDEKDSYHRDALTKSYSPLIHFSREFVSKKENKNIDKLEQTLTVFAHMVYGWMPTIVKCDFTKLEDKENFWNNLEKNVKNFEDEKKFIESVKKCITGNNGKLNDPEESKNGSIVGTSKLLHFLNPQKYAIYDSRIYISISEKKANNYNNTEYYIKYMNKLTEYIKNNKTEMNKIYEKLIKRGWLEKTDFDKPEDSYLRCLDLLFWLDYRHKIK